ncbi:MAG: tetratricopeptide repeat protein [Treponema sp.]|nr:tetratricopeptide repeat protein [Treponema sp.]
MKTIKFLFALLLLSVVFFGCTKSSKTIIRMQKLETGVSSPTTEAELKDAIKKYQDRIADIQLSDTQVGIWYKMLAVRYLDAKMYGEAMKNFQIALQYYPANQNLYYYVGICAGYMSHAALDYSATGSNPERSNYLKLAESAYLRAIEIEPRYARALYAIGVLYVMELDECEKAVPYLETLLTIEKRNFDGMFVLARAYYVIGEYDKAAALYDNIAANTKDQARKAEAQANKKIVMDAAYAK